MSSHLLPVYKRLPVAFSHGQGVWLFDLNGNKYFDALSGYAVTSLGHKHPAITRAIQSQAEKLLLIPNTVTNPEQEALAARLCELTGFHQIFFGNSGAEAVEGLIKLSRLYGHSRDIKAPKIIVMEDAFHGRTMACLTACGNPRYQKDFDPLVPGFIRAPFDDIPALEQLAKNDENIVAVLVEPIQGEGGVHIPKPGYLKQLRELCDRKQWLLLCDEVQTGVGRTGQLYAYMHDNIQPDAFSTAKALGAGIPISAFVLNEHCASLFHEGSHGTTFGGNPFCTSVGLTSLNTIVNEKLAENATKQGKRILTALKDAFANHPQVVDIRGKGLMIGVELDHPCKAMTSKALEKGLLLNVAAERVVRLLPALIINDEETDILTQKIIEILKDYLD